MAEIRIEVDTSAADGLIDALTQAQRGRAIGRAINRTATTVRRSILRELSRQIGLPQRRLSQNVRLTRVNQALFGRLSSGRQGVLGRGVVARATISASGSDISVGAFGAKQIAAGVSFKPGRKARRSRIAGAFLLQGRSRPRAFVRATEAPNVLARDVERVRRRRRVRSRGTDIPIAKLVLPGVSQAMFDDDLQRQIQAQGEDVLARRLAESIEFELRGAINRRRRR